MTVHILSLGVSSAKVSGGGTSLFRGLAAVLSTRSDVLAYEPVVDSPDWCHPRVTAVGHRDAQEAIGQALDRVRPGDVIVKVAGALPGRWDMVCDIELAHLRQGTDVRLIYADADAPSRLPVFQYSGSYLDTVLPVADAVVLWGGGPRAAHGYRWLTGAPILAITVATTWFGITSPPRQPPSAPTWDVAAVFGGDVSRGARVAQVLADFVEAGLTVAFAGREPENLPKEISRLGFLDGEGLASLVGGSRFSLSLLRDDVRGYADVHACRMIESARLGSLLVSETFPGIARLFVPGRDLVVLDHNSRDTARQLTALSATAHRDMTSRARARVAAVAGHEVGQLLQVVIGTEGSSNRSP